MSGNFAQCRKIGNDGVKRELRCSIGSGLRHSQIGNVLYKSLGSIATIRLQNSKNRFGLRFLGAMGIGTGFGLTFLSQSENKIPKSSFGLRFSEVMGRRKNYNNC